MTLLNILIYLVPIVLILSTLWTGISCMNFYKNEKLKSNED